MHDVELLPQALFARTHIFPDPVKVLRNETLMDVPLLLLMLTPAGTVHVYDVAPGTAAIEYVILFCLQTPHDGPLTGPGVPGVEEICNTDGRLELQELLP
jgi:hypothetical protein